MIDRAPETLSVIDEQGQEIEISQSEFWQYGADALPTAEIVDIGNLPRDEWIKGEHDE